jgi:hypothetical protein
MSQDGLIPGLRCQVCCAQGTFYPRWCTPRWLPVVFNEAVFAGVSMPAEKTFSRINAGKSMLFLGRFYARSKPHPRIKATPANGVSLG